MVKPMSDVGFVIGKVSVLKNMLKRKKEFRNCGLL